MVSGLAHTHEGRSMRRMPPETNLVLADVDVLYGR